MSQDNHRDPGKPGTDGTFSCFSDIFFCPMARLARVVAVDIPHHVTQRANARRFILESDSDKLVYLDLLRKYCTLYELSVVGYCLMSNHVHLVVTPLKIDSLHLTMKNAHGRYGGWRILISVMPLTFVCDPLLWVPHSACFSRGAHVE